MRSAYSAAATASAVHEIPTQITPRQARCMPINGITRSQSMRSASASSPAATALVSNHCVTAFSERCSAADDGLRTVTPCGDDAVSSVTGDGAVKAMTGSFHATCTFAERQIFTSTWVLTELAIKQ